MDRYEEQLGYSSKTKNLEHLIGLPFYFWDSKESRSSIRISSNTFNHTIGLPQKDGKPMPLFDYEYLLFNKLQTNKHVWIMKATGLGVTEFMLRYMAWLCFSNNSF